MKQLLQLLENDCTLTPAQLASMTGSTYPPGVCHRPH